jgi:hypothetical protein
MLRAFRHKNPGYLDVGLDEAFILHLYGPPSTSYQSMRNRKHSGAEWDEREN